MAIVAFEKWKSRAGKASVEDPSINIVYGVKGTLDETEVDAAIADPLIGAPLTWNGLTRQGWTRECLGPTNDGGLWEVTVTYDRNALKGTGTSQMSVDLTGGHEKITQSKETIGRYAVALPGLDSGPPTDPPHLGGSIGVTDTSIEGVDITIPKLEVTITAIVAATSLAMDFLSELNLNTATVNDDTFKLKYYGQQLVFFERECLFLGAQMSDRGNGDLEFHLKFSGQRTVKNLKIGLGDGSPGGATIPEKKGWDYLWVYYKEQKVDGFLARVPQGVYVERVYDAINFSDFFGPLNLLQA